MNDYDDGVIEHYNLVMYFELVNNMSNYFTNSGNASLAPSQANAWCFNFNNCLLIAEAKALALEYLIRAEMLPDGSSMPDQAWQECIPVWLHSCSETNDAPT